jgi:flagellar biosynthesis protein FlhF
MQIKTFRALNMREALRLIKEELGPDAVILSTKEVKDGSPIFGLFSRPMVEVTAAVDRAAGAAGEETLRARYGGDVDERAAAILSHGQLPGDGSRGVDLGTSLFAPGMSHNARAVSFQPSNPSPFADHMQSATLIQSLRDELAQIKEDVSALREAPPLRRPGGQGWTSMEEELRGVRRLVSTLVQKDDELFVERLPKPLQATYAWLCDSGLDREIVLGMIKELQPHLPVAEEHLPARVRSTVFEHLGRAVKTAGPLLRNELGPKAVMVVGPTGVGKTTTIAKLAAHYALNEKRKVALITLDTYRVAAVEQLRVYGNILGLAVDVALTCDDLAGLLRLRKNADLILIDTAGRSPLDEAALRELKKLLVRYADVETHLVLSAATREADLQMVLARFAALPVNRIIFSKLDETSQYGGIINVLRRSGIPLSYLSTGQRVPEDLEVATFKVLSELLLEGLPAIRTSKRETRKAPERPPMKPATNTASQPARSVRSAKENLLTTLGRALVMRSARKNGD